MERPQYLQVRRVEDNRNSSKITLKWYKKMSYFKDL